MTTDAEFWTRTAPKYFADPIADVPGYERTIARVAALLQPQDRVIEFGCGTGTTALRLAPAVLQYRATDLSPGMIAIAEGRLAQDPVPNLSFAVATADSVAAEFAARGGSGWDVALSFSLLHLVPDLPGTLRAIYGVLRPGGLFISKTSCLREMNPLIPLALPLARLFGKAPATVRNFSAAELEGEIVAAGFAIDAVERHASKGTDTRPFIVARRGT